MGDAILAAHCGKFLSEFWSLVGDDSRDVSSEPLRLSLGESTIVGHRWAPCYLSAIAPMPGNQFCAPICVGTVCPFSRNKTPKFIASYGSGS